MARHYANHVAGAALQSTWALVCHLQGVPLYVAVLQVGGCHAAVKYMHAVLTAEPIVMSGSMGCMQLYPCSAACHLSVPVRDYADLLQQL